MRRGSLAVFIAVCGVSVAGCGGSSLHLVAGKPSVQQAARQYSKQWFGDAHPAVMHVETVRLAYGAQAVVIELSGHFTIHPMCMGPIPASRCPTEHPRQLMMAFDLLNPKYPLGYEDTSAAQLARIARARHARPSFEIFPDFATQGIEGVRCTIPRGTPSGGVVPGICLTQDSPYRQTENAPYMHPSRVEFTERWPLTRRIHDRNEAVWIVTFNRSGHIQSIRVTGHPPQLQK